ncbi:hypothetical protein ANN_09114 [Periplaneta americana]|uniref:Uncharacterized protein n=1 Tax=Periplaneta americana TaxID=6978 RepID=A0ABQ8TKG9_PERAM|nr:hypothetical protein ANN_09114 [Periplaneta americana]
MAAKPRGPGWISGWGNTRRIDIIAFKESTRSGFIIDPTVRFETNEEQPVEVDKEKNNICNPTIPYYLQKYQLEELEVIGLLVGARGDNAGEVSPGSSTESRPAFARIGLRENPGKNLNQVTCPDRDSNPGHLVSQPDVLTVTPQTYAGGGLAGSRRMAEGNPGQPLKSGEAHQRKKEE